MKFNNPFYVQNCQAVNNPLNSEKSRPSVQEIMNKYQSKPSAQKSDQPIHKIEKLQENKNRASYDNIMMLDSISSEGSSYFYQKDDQDQNGKKEGSLQKVIKNSFWPIQNDNLRISENELQQNFDDIAIATFGQKKWFGAQQTPNLSPINAENQNTINRNFQSSIQQQKQEEDEFLKQLILLKEKILKMLQQYSYQFKFEKDKESQRQLKKIIKIDAKKLQKEYCELIDGFKTNNLSNLHETIVQDPKKEEEIKQILSLVDEFLHKFLQNRQDSKILQTYQLILQFKKLKLQTEFAQFSDEKLKKSQIEIIKINKPNNIFTSDIFSESKEEKNLICRSSPIKENRFFKKNSLNQLPTDDINAPGKLYIEHSSYGLNFTNQNNLFINSNDSYNNLSIANQFPEESFYQQKEISVQRMNQKIQDLISHLSNELKQENLPYTQMILTDAIKNMNTLIHSQDTDLAKSIILKLQNGIEQLKFKKDGSTSIYNYLNKAIKIIQKNTDQIPQRNSEPQKSSCIYLNFIQKELNQIQKNHSYTVQKKEEPQIKRQFYDKALQIKKLLPRNDQGKTMMVTEIYEEYIQNYDGVKNLDEFIKQKFNYYK